MNLSLIKPIVAAIGTTIMLILTAACSSTMARNSNTHIISNDKQSFIMRQENDGPTVYIIGSKVYEWQNLTPQQQQKLKAIELAMQQVEEKLDAQEAKFEPLSDALEDQAEALEEAAEAMEREFEEFEEFADVETARTDSLRALNARKETLRVKQTEISQQEKALHQRERELQEIERDFREVENQLDREFDRYVAEIINVLEN